MTSLFLLLLSLITSCSAPVYQEITVLPDPPPPIVQKAPKKPATANRDIILIDAGHGGEDFGAKSVTKPRYHEKNLTLTTAKLLKKYLEQLGYAAIMTRTEDLFVPLDKRAKVANQLDPKLFVSVHYNSAPSEEAQGIEVYYYRNAQDQWRTAESKKLAQAILDETIKSTSAKSRGVKHGNFLVIRETEMPAVLIECGFLTHNGEMERIKDPAYLKKLAWGIAQGVHNYME